MVKKLLKQKKICFGSWNVITLVDADCCPERTTAIVGHELARYITTAALRETSRAHIGRVKEFGADYTFF